jgi:hypothetical protein
MLSRQAMNCRQPPKGFAAGEIPYQKRKTVFHCNFPLFTLCFKSESGTIELKVGQSSAIFSNQNSPFKEPAAMSKRKREADGGGDDGDFFGPSSSAPAKKGGGKRSSGRLKTLGSAFRTLDEETRRSILKARLDALEADNHGEEAGGLGDDEEFYVDDEGVSAPT